MTWRTGINADRAAELARRATHDDADYRAGRAIACHIISRREPEQFDYGAHREKKSMGRPPKPVMSDRGERFESMAAAEVELQLSKGSVFYAVKTGGTVAGRKWAKVEAA